MSVSPTKKKKGMLKLPSEKVRQKILEICSHINTRIQVQPTLQLPVREILSVFTSPDARAAPLVSSFCLIYLETGLTRAPLDIRREIVPQLLAGIASRPVSQQNTALQIFLDSAPQLNYITGTAEERKQRFTFSQSDADRVLVLGFFLDVLLYLPNSQILSKAEMKQQQQQQQAGSTSAVAQLSTVPGMSQEGVDRVTKAGKLIWTQEEWYKKKEAIVDALTCGIFQDVEILPHLLVASAQGNPSVAHKADAYLRSIHLTDYDCIDPIIAPASLSPEDLTKRNVAAQALVKSLMDLFLGDADNKRIEDVRVKRLAPAPATRYKILQTLCRFAQSANMGPLGLQVSPFCHIYF